MELQRSALWPPVPGEGESGVKWCGVSQQSRTSPPLPHPRGTHIGPESDSVQVLFDAWSPRLLIDCMAVLMIMSMSSVVDALMRVAMTMAMVQILMRMSMVVTVGMPMPDALMSVARGMAVSMVEILM